MRLRLTTDMIRDEALDRVQTLSGQQLLACYQCGRCSAGCPVVDEMDIVPERSDQAAAARPGRRGSRLEDDLDLRVVPAVRLALPEGRRVLEHLRRAQGRSFSERGFRPREWTLTRSRRSWCRTRRRWVWSGPSQAERLDVPEEEMKIPYYPGCTLHERARDFDDSARECARALGVELEELPIWTCCGAVYPARDRQRDGHPRGRQEPAYASRIGDKVVTLCSFCYNVLKRTNKVMRDDKDKREKANLFLRADTEARESDRELHARRTTRARSTSFTTSRCFATWSASTRWPRP